MREKRTFELDSEKLEEFQKREKTSEKMMERFFAHEPRSGVKTPFKEGKKYDT